MTAAVDAGHVERFRAVVARNLGLQVDESRTRFLGDVLQRRLEHAAHSADAYLSLLDCRPEPAELAALARELTVGETYFFRNIEQFNALAEIALPDRMRANEAGRSLRVLSAGCASGEEPYTISMILHEAGAAAWDAKVRAVDLNPAVLEKAARARYSDWALRETPDEMRKKWFRRAGRDLVLDEAIRALAAFEERNLAVDDSALWRPESYDIIFCRNVMMYFAPEQALALIGRIARALRPGGYLFLGHAETLRGLSCDKFHLQHTHGTFYYQLGAGHAGAAPRSAPSLADAATPWWEAIRDASSRVTALTTPREAPETEPAGLDPAQIFELLREERFTDALALVRDAPPSPRADPDLLLLEAVLLANSRLTEAAEQVCRRLLDLDKANAGAYYILALCRDSAGDPAGAAECYRTAAFLDPAFAMPRLQFGLFARRMGHREAAAGDLAAALALLKREDSSRILLFGGGFKRAALVALCESALRDCGGAP